MRKMILITSVMLSFLTGCGIKKPYLLVAERSGVSKVNQAGDFSLLLERNISSIKTLGQEIFILGNSQIIVKDIDGNKLREISIPQEALQHSGCSEFVVIPDGRLAFLDNQNDAIYFMNSKGEFLQTVRFNEKQDGHMQNMDGVVVDEQLIISENGYKQLIQVDLRTYEVSIFRDLSNLRGWLGAITYANGEFYLCQSKAIYTFQDNNDAVRKIAMTPEGNITGITYSKGSLYVVVNGMSRIKEKSLAAKYRTRQGALYEVRPETGEVRLIKEGLNYPRGVQIINR